MTVSLVLGGVGGTSRFLKLIGELCFVGDHVSKNKLDSNIGTQKASVSVFDVHAVTFAPPQEYYNVTLNN